MALWNGKALTAQELAFWFNEAEAVLERMRESQKPSTDTYEESWTESPAPTKPSSTPTGS